MPLALPRNGGWRVEQGDCLELLAALPPSSVDAIVTDPPYGIGFGGHAWDKPRVPERTEADSPRAAPDTYQRWCQTWATEGLRILKPGGHLVSFGAARTAHHVACGIEAAGFELRDTLLWLFGQGFPKSRNLTGPWAGWGTALKPAYEPIILARKPLAATSMQSNAERYGTGALHIDACRTDGGRWPPNVIVSHDPACDSDSCSDECPVVALGSRARFFYCPKASRAERDAGCHGLQRRVIDTFKIGADNEQQAAMKPVGNFHPTVKPLALMRWLIRLITTADALVVDPFCGSGSTGCAAVLEGRRFLGIDRDPDYARVARARIDHHATTAPDAEEGLAA